MYYIGHIPFGSNGLQHYGRPLMKWGVRNGPPYPIGDQKGLTDFIASTKSIKYKDFDRLMSPEKVGATRSGSCHDVVLYQCLELKKLGFKPKAHFFIEANKSGQGGATHSITYFQNAGSWWWLENSWGSQKGLHKYSSQSSLIKDVRKKWEKNNQFPILYDGAINYKSMKPGMNLGELLDLVNFE